MEDQELIRISEPLLNHLEGEISKINMKIETEHPYYSKTSADQKPS